MQLPPDQIERFYRIWFSVLHFVNEHRRLLPSFPLVPGEQTVSPADAVQVRDALWSDDALREQFIAENPRALSPADLEIVASWQYRLTGHFYIFRHLKRHTVFLSLTTPMHAYGVLGLVSSLEEVTGPNVPTYVETVLLPWEQQIIYDGLIVPYPVLFGKGIRDELNDAYRNAQEREGIITTLLPVTETSATMRQQMATRNGKVLEAFRRDLARGGLSSKMVEQHVHNIEQFAHNVLASQSSPRGILDLSPTDVATYLASGNPQANPVSMKRFVKFVAETGRIDYEDAEVLREEIKRARR